MALTSHSASSRGTLKSLHVGLQGRSGLRLNKPLILKPFDGLRSASRCYEAWQQMKRLLVKRFDCVTELPADALTLGPIAGTYVVLFSTCQTLLACSSAQAEVAGSHSPVVTPLLLSAFAPLGRAETAQVSSSSVLLHGRTMSLACSRRHTLLCACCCHQGWTWGRRSAPCGPVCS
jgi:hypothetical protein